jgi:hypothetical protein
MSTPVPEFAQCPWPLDPACLTDDWNAFPSDVQERATMLASATLHRLTGYRVGGCPITVRPCKKGCAVATIPPYMDGTRWMVPYINSQGMWINSCGCTTDCSCTEVCEILLPEPVGEVYEVSLNGAIVDAGDYRVDGTNRLVWVGDGTCPWPTCQDMNADLTEDNTFSVTYLNSFPPDGLAAYAAGVLANEYAKACTGGKCRLPSNVTAVTRQGVSFEIAAGSFPDGVTGIREVDAFLAIWNPGNIRRATVWSPDVGQFRVTR